MKYYSISLLWLFIFSIQKTTQAQDTVLHSTTIKAEDSLLLKNFEDSITNLLGTKSYFQTSLTYLNNNVYLGRKDSVATPYVTPSIGYYHKSGIYMNASASYLAKAGNGRIDLVAVEIGYGFKAGKFDGQTSAAKFWYNSASYNVKSELKGSIAFFGSYNFGFIKPTLTPVLNIGNKMDFALTMGLEHTFYLADDAMDITPTINTNAGTQNYYNSYYRVRRYSGKRKKIPANTKVYISGEVQNSAQLKMLDYEFTMPLNYTIKKITLNFSPVYVIPVNPAVVVIKKTIAGQPPIPPRTATEKLNNSFFFQAGITYKF